MAGSNQDDGTPNVTCVEAMTTSDGTLFSLVVITDWETFSSFVYRADDMDEDSDLIYEYHGWMKGMWVSESGVVFLTDDEGGIHENTSGTWARIDTQVDASLNMIFGFGDEAVFACGDNGSFVRRTSRGWEKIEMRTKSNLYAIHGLDAEHLYVVGANGTAINFENGKATLMQMPTNVDLIDVYVVSSSGQVIICSEDGVVLEGSADAWKSSIPEAGKTLYSISEFGGKVLIGAGLDGVLEYKEGSLSEFKPGIPAYGIRSKDKYLAVSGDDQVLRFDGQKWLGEAYGD